VKVKHNKKRNTAFLYEVLVRELAKTIIEKDASKRDTLLDIVKEGFAEEEVLGQELGLYQTLLETKGVAGIVAEKILLETKSAFGRISPNNRFSAQSKIITRINKELPANVWNNFIPNYKSLATISAIFNDKTPIKQKVLFEDSIIKNMSAEASVQEEKLEPIDNIVYRTFVEKFNNEYKDLLDEQKKLLGVYVSSFHNNGLELKVYLNEEIGRLKTTLEKSLTITEIVDDSTMTEKTQKVLTLLESFSRSEPTDKMVKSILQIQPLVKEVESND